MPYRRLLKSVFARCAIAITVRLLHWKVFLNSRIAELQFSSFMIFPLSFIAHRCYQ